MNSNLFIQKQLKVLNLSIEKVEKIEKVETIKVEKVKTKWKIGQDFSIRICKLANNERS